MLPLQSGREVAASGEVTTAGEQEIRRKHVLNALNTSGVYHSMKERLKRSVVCRHPRRLTHTVTLADWPSATLPLQSILRLPLPLIVAVSATVSARPCLCLPVTTASSPSRVPVYRSREPGGPPSVSRFHPSVANAAPLRVV